MITAIDPGTTESAWVSLGWDGTLHGFGKEANEALLERLPTHRTINKPRPVLVVEKVASYGMPVGEAVFETVFWSGRFVERWAGEFERIPRLDVRLHFCHSTRAKDGNVIQALKDRFGGKGTKANPGYFYGFAADVWQAFALGVYYLDTRRKNGI